MHKNSIDKGTNLTISDTAFVGLNICFLVRFYKYTENDNSLKVIYYQIKVMAVTVFV